MCNTLIGAFCKEHENWYELLTNEPYNLKIKENNNFVLFHYDQITSDFDNPLVREARGIIFRKDNWEKPACWPFNKFGNYGESYVPDLDWSNVTVNEKLDGTLILVWWNWEGGWRVSTRGTIDAWGAPMSDCLMENFGYYFTEVLEKTYHFKDFDDFTDGLDMNYTYMFELVGPYNKVVIPYEEPAIYVLGSRNIHTGKERSALYTYLDDDATVRLHLPKWYTYKSLDETIEEASKLPWNEEGFVATDENFNRVKIKSPAYVIAHHSRNNGMINRKHLIGVLLRGEKDEFLCYAPEYAEKLNKCEELMNKFNVVGNSYAEKIKFFRDLDRKTVSEIIQRFIPKLFQAVAYKNIKEDFTMKEFTADWTHEKWDDYLTRAEEMILWKDLS